jgi:hypothetical protein
MSSAFLIGLNFALGQADCDQWPGKFPDGCNLAWTCASKEWIDWNEFQGGTFLWTWR